MKGYLTPYTHCDKFLSKALVICLEEELLHAQQDTEGNSQLKDIEKPILDFNIIAIDMPADASAAFLGAAYHLYLFRRFWPHIVTDF